jgi:hypothetical protein
VTNARATSDNTRNYPSIQAMGQNGLLLYALGIFASRDNVWTSLGDIKQDGCGNQDFCYEPNAHLDNAVAVLSGGPYGIADAMDFVNETVVAYSCRIDGLLLRPHLPLASLDFTFTDDDALGSSVWSAHDDFGSWRWSYVIGVDLKKDIAITPDRLTQGMPCSYELMVAWEVIIGEPVQKVVPFSNSNAFMLPKSKPLNLPYTVDSPSHTHFGTAPVLPNGMAFLGDTSKFASMSYGRISSMEINDDNFIMTIVGAPYEAVTFTYLKNAEKFEEMSEVKCNFASACSGTDQHGNSYCKNTLICMKGANCICRNLLQDDVQMKATE